jgi:tRNA (Thr-GGU) A37 N-methylase
MIVMMALWMCSGITLARIERVDKRARCLHVTACDLVQDTPILDIKVLRVGVHCCVGAWDAMQ